MMTASNTAKNVQRRIAVFIPMRSMVVPPTNAGRSSLTARLLVNQRTPAVRRVNLLSLPP